MVQEEGRSGAPNPYFAVLSTATNHGVPHRRVVAVREITEEGIFLVMLTFVLNTMYCHYKICPRCFTCGGNVLPKDLDGYFLI